MAFQFAFDTFDPNAERCGDHVQWCAGLVQVLVEVSHVRLGQWCRDSGQDAFGVASSIHTSRGLNWLLLCLRIGLRGRCCGTVR